jgi:hypothetical protein
VKLDLARGIDPEGRSEVARADKPRLTKYLNATELGSDPRDPLSPNLAGASFSDDGDPLGRLSVTRDRRITVS